MVARIQRLIVLALVAVLVGSIAWGSHGHQPALALVAPGLVLAGYLAVLALEFILLRRSGASDDALRPSFRDLCTAWLGEILAAPRAFLWRQPFFEHAIVDELGDISRPRRGVVWVHGFFCNRAMWNPCLQRLRDAGVPFVAVNLEPVFGSIDDYREAVGAAVEALRASTSLAPVVVAHRMGGLAVRAWLASCGDASEVHRVVTIASPHGGTRMARHSFARNIGEMQFASAWLTHLAARETPSTRARFICFWSHCDNIVFPTRSATLDGADNRHLPATAHVRMVLHSEVIETVLALVA